MPRTPENIGTFAVAFGPLVCPFVSTRSTALVGLVPLDITPVSDFALPLKLIEYTCLGLPSITVGSTAIAHYLRPD
jgi:hypothetical protein